MTRGGSILTQSIPLACRRCWIAGGLLLLLGGCAMTVAPKPPKGEEPRPTAAAPSPRQERRPVVPPADHCGPALDPKVWKIQCEKGGLAMMCRRSDPTDRRCAYMRKGRYRWTYGSYCAHALGCSRRACR